MPRIKRTHVVARHLIHNGQQYVKGDSITFGPEISDAEIKELRNNGTLDGPRAEELLEERIFNERAMGVVGPTVEQERELWKTFVRMTPAQRAEVEKQQARIQETSEAARIANISEAGQRANADDELAEEPDAEDEGE